MLTGAVSFSYGVVTGIASEIPTLEPGKRPPVEEDGFRGRDGGEAGLTGSAAPAGYLRLVESSNR